LHPYKKQIQTLKQGYLILIYFSFWFIFYCLIIFFVCCVLPDF
jgi:hypothetical protein